MRKTSFLLVFLLIVPLPFSQLLVNSFTIPEDISTDFVYTLEYDSSSDFVIEDRIIRIVSIEDGGNSESAESPSSPSFPHFSAANYPSYTTTTGNASDVQRGETIDASSLTEYDLLGLVPVDRGTHYWYDLEEILNNQEAAAGSLSNSVFALEFAVPVSTGLMAIGFNLSDITTLISNVISIYVTDNLSNYLSDYLMFSEISFHTYNFHKNNPSSEMLFTFWDHPTTTQVGNLLTADTPYYIVLESAENFTLQTSDDQAGIDDNRVYIKENDNWVEQLNLDVDLTIFTGSLVQTSAVSSGQSNILYDTTFITGINHVLVASYYDSSSLYDCSSDFLALIILDSFNPDHLTLTSPPTAEYSDQIQLIAKVENSFFQPLQGEVVDFYYSSDNQSWISLEQGTSNEDGFAIVSYSIVEASGTKYFKAVLNLLASYSSTDQQKEIINIILPQIYCRYGSAPGYHDLAQYQMNARIIDNDGQPITGQMVFFYVQGSLDPIFLATNSSGWASSAYGFLDWGAGYYPNSFWVTTSMDSDLYIYQSTTYSDINIARSPIFLQYTENLQSYWNEPVNIDLSFNDTEGDAIPSLNYEVILYSFSDDQNTSLGLYQTDTFGEGTISFSSGFFNPGEYTIYIKVDSADYFYLEETMSLSILSDQAQITINISESEVYVYGSVIPLEIYVTDHYGTPLENIQVLVHVSAANFPDIWDEFYTIQTNSSGYAILGLSLDMQVGDILNILVFTSDYYLDGILLYGQAAAFVSYFNCVQAPSEITEIADLSGTNQDTIEIRGRVLSNGNPVVFETVIITILGIQYPVTTDGDGYFTLNYLIEQGGTITVEIVFTSSSNYLESNKTITLTSSACPVIIYATDIYHNSSNPVTFSVNIESVYGTTPTGVEVRFYWFDGANWIYLDSAYTDSMGYASLTSAITFPLGIYQWKAEVAGSSSWLINESTHYFQVGIRTSIIITVQPTAEYKQSITILASVKDEYNQPIIVEVSFYLNGTFIGSAFSDILGNVIFVWIIDFVPGEYVLTAQTMETGMYFASSDSDSITIEKTLSLISCEDVFIFYDEDFTLTIHLFSQVTGISAAYLDINIEGIYNTQLLTDFEGNAYWLITLLEPGIYTVVISFSGDNFYYSSSHSITLQVDKMPTTIDFTAPNQEYESMYSIYGYIEDSFNQPRQYVSVTLLVNGSIVQTDITDIFGYFTFSINLLPGTYMVEIEYEGDNHYLSASNQKTIYIWKIDSSVQGTVIWESMTLSITALLLDSNNNPITDQLVFFYLNGSYIDHTLTNSTGYAVIELNGIEPGFYTIEVVFSGTSIYAKSSQIIVLDQEKLQTEMSVQVSEGIYGTTTTTIQVYLTSSSVPIADQVIKLVINGVEYLGLTNSSGYLLMSLNLYESAGIYSLDVIYEGSTVYSYVSLTTSFYISKAEALIDLNFQYENFQPIIYGTLSTVMTLEGEAIQILVDYVGYEILYTDEFGEFETILILPAGTYYITASFAGNNNYFAFEKTIEVVIHKTTTVISIQDSLNQTYESETTIGFTLLDVLDNPLVTSVIVKLDGSYYATVNTNSLGYAEILLTADISAGIHILTIEYQGDTNYYQTSADITLYTKYAIVLESIQTISEIYGMSGSISGKIDNYSGNLILVQINLEIDGQFFTTYTDGSGNFLFVLDQYLPAGDYQVRIHVIATDYINYFEHLFNFTRGKGDASITINTDQFVFNEDIILAGTLVFESTPLVGVEITIYINNIEIGSLTTDSEGNFYFPSNWLDFSPGSYSLRITASITDPNIAETSQNFNLEILQDAISCTITWGDAIVEEEIELTITLKDSNGETIPYYAVLIDFEGTVHTLSTNQLGIIHFTHTLTNAGKLLFIISSSETTYYLIFQNSTMITVEKAEAVIDVVQNKVLYNSSLGLEIRLESELGNPLPNQPLLIRINSTIYTAYTDINGSVIIDLSDYLLGNYSITIDFTGSNNYEVASFIGIIEIIPQQTQMKLVEEGEQWAIYLLDSENRSLSNREITIKYLTENGTTLHTETYRTNSNGLIIFEILSKAFLSESEYLVFNFRGDSYY
ncbi:MAG: carboxypeptidase regulatory-like domain-containing protein, partial [Candidatus Heimdallarchaeota archaeon]|nr:carboxypeptidase regulatory-like domain-containing protein [Candidatus Heimdallarchaeota archaeon]